MFPFAKGMHLLGKVRKFEDMKAGSFSFCLSLQ